MPIETTIAELTDAIKSLTKALLANNGAAMPQAEKAVTEKKDVKPVAEKKAVDTTATATAQATAQTKKVETSGDEPASIDFVEQIQKPIVALAAGGKRAEALEILNVFGAKRASDIKPEDYARAVELIGKVA
jgi:hypothetical protein